KTGIHEEYLDEFIQRLKKYDKIEIVGFMAMGKQNNLTKTDEVFKRVNLLKKYYKLSELSIGMSDDYQVAIENGATMVRIGRLLVK
ncbi:MAG: alanine racemase, partial [Acholeplasmataceae bacterium]|nr:alanine racemase [Acholeplasmataceae bacterium]